MKRIAIELPEEIVAMLTSQSDDLSEQVKTLAVLELFRERRISAGKAAEILGMNLRKFLAYLTSEGIPLYDLDSDTLQEDAENARPQTA